MKVFVLGSLLTFLPAVFGCYAYPPPDISHMIEDECVESSKVGYSEIEHMRLSNEIPENDQMKTFVKCVLEKRNVMNNIGSVNQNIYTYEIPSNDEKVYTNVANQCKAESGSDSGETARKIMNCFMKGGQKVLSEFRNPKA